MTVLVVGATGSIGGEVTAALLAHGAAVRALVRNPDRARLLPDGVDPVVGDLRDASSVAAALTGVSAALYISPHDPAEEHLADMFRTACERLGVRLVFAGVYVNGPNAVARWCTRTLFGLIMPHYRGKLRIGHRMAAARARPVVFGVTNFYQNDELVRADILDGRYGLPASGAGVNRIDLRDVGEVVARAMTDPRFRSGAYGLSGPESISGVRAAGIWSEVLGRPVTYEGDRPDWADALARSLSDAKLVDFQRSYGLLAKRGVATSAHDVATTTRLLGRPPRSYETYVRDTAERWGALPAATGPHTAPDDAPTAKEHIVTSATSPSHVDIRPSRRVLLGVLALTAVSVLGGVISVAGGLSPSLIQAMGPTGRLSIPLPMVVAQLLLAVAAGTRRRFLVLFGSGFVTATLFVGVISGFFDGGYADPRLTTAQRAWQLTLVVSMFVVGTIAGARFVRALRR